MLDALRIYRRDLHRIPELMYDLPETRAYLLNALRDARAQVEVTEKGGITVFYDTGKPYALAFRADMDALPVTEQTGVDYASVHPGMMHACGHDGHMAMLLAFCDWLNDHAAELPCNVLAVFQPAEESGGGAEHIAKSGIFAERKVRGIYAIHVDPMLPVGTVAARPGEFMAKSSEIHITVHGRSAHAAQWRKGIDATEACAWLYLQLLDMERALPEAVPRLLKFGLLHSGVAVNVISDRTELGGTMRAFNMDVFNDMKAKMLSLARQCEKRYGVTVEVDVGSGYPPVINDEELYHKLERALAGQDFRYLPEPEMLSEDFAFYQEAVPGLMFKLGVGCGVALHASTMIYDEEALVTGVQTYIALAQEG